eukprot:403361171
MSIQNKRDLQQEVTFQSCPSYKQQQLILIANTSTEYKNKDYQEQNGQHNDDNFIQGLGKYEVSEVVNQLDLNFCGESNDFIVYQSNPKTRPIIKVPQQEEYIRTMIYDGKQQAKLHMRHAITYLRDYLEKEELKIMRMQGLLNEDRLKEIALKNKNIIKCFDPTKFQSLAEFGPIYEEKIQNRFKRYKSKCNFLQNNFGLILNKEFKSHEFFNTKEESSWWSKKVDADIYAAFETVKLLQYLKLIDNHFLIDFRLKQQSNYEDKNPQSIQQILLSNKMKNQNSKIKQLNEEIYQQNQLQSKIFGVQEDCGKFISTIENQSMMYNKIFTNSYLKCLSLNPINSSIDSLPRYKMGLLFNIEEDVQPQSVNNNKIEGLSSDDQIICNFIKNKKESQITEIYFDGNRKLAELIVCFHLYSVFLMNSSLHELYYRILTRQYDSLFFNIQNSKPDQNQEDQKHHLFSDLIQILERDQVCKKFFDGVFSHKTEQNIQAKNVVNFTVNQSHDRVYNLIVPLKLVPNTDQYIIDEIILQKTFETMRRDIIQNYLGLKIHKESSNQSIDKGCVYQNPFTLGSVQIQSSSLQQNQCNLTTKVILLPSQEIIAQSSAASSDNPQLLSKQLKYHNQVTFLKSTQEFYLITQGVFLKRNSQQRLTKSKKIKSLTDSINSDTVQQIFNKDSLVLKKENSQLGPSIVKQRKIKPQDFLEVKEESILDNEMDLKHSQELVLLDISSEHLIQLPFKIQQYMELQRVNQLYSILTQGLREKNFYKEFIIGEMLNANIQEKVQSEERKNEPINLDDEIFNSDEESHNYKAQINPEQSIKSQKLNDIQSQKYLEDMLQLNFEEALSSSQVDKNQNYERLEFLGDSVLNFLSLLELCTNFSNLKNKEIDILKVDTVCNKRLAKAAETKNLQRYLIELNSNKHGQSQGGSNSHQVIPGLFERQDYELNISSKTLQQTESKVVFLNQLRQKILSQLEYQKLHNLSDPIMTDDYETIVNCIIERKSLQQALVHYIEQNYPQEARYSLNFEKDYPNQYYLNKMLKNLKLSQLDLELIIIDSQIDKLQFKLKSSLSKRSNESSIRSNQSSSQIVRQSKQASHSASQNPKQIKLMADVVEALTGLFSLQNLEYSSMFLKQLGIMSKTLKELQEIEQKPLEIIDIEGDMQIQKLTSKVTSTFNVLEQQILKGTNFEFKDRRRAFKCIMHKSYIESEEAINEFGKRGGNQASHQQIDEIIANNERFEFIGDSILNYAVTDYVFHKTKNQVKDNSPKYLHLMRQNVVNNIMLTHIVVQLGIDKLILFDTKAFSQPQNSKKQWSIANSLKIIREAVQQSPMSENIQAYNKLQIRQQQINALQDGKEKKDLAKILEQDFKDFRYSLQYIHDVIHEHNNKMFSDVFEAIIGAIYMDCRDFNKTKDVVLYLMKDYLAIFTDMGIILDNPRTAAIELWDQQTYSRGLKLQHITTVGNNHTMFIGTIGDMQALRIRFQNTKKNKIREFYKNFFLFLQSFVKVCKDENIIDKDLMLKRLEQFRIDFKISENV